MEKEETNIFSLEFKDSFGQKLKNTLAFFNSGNDETKFNALFRCIIWDNLLVLLKLC